MLKLNETPCRAASATLLACFVCLALTLPSSAWADDNKSDKPKVFPPDARLFSVQLSNADWSARWWQWALTIPNPNNPTLDLTGEKCGVEQSGPVFFLAGAPVTTAVTRTCTIPAGKVLFFPLITSECSNVEPAPFFGANQEQLSACVKKLIDGVSVPSLKLSIDGAPVGNLGSYRVQSPLFAYTLPALNQLGAPGGTSPISIADGFFVMVQLPPGQHTLHFEAVIASGPGAPFSQNVTYHLKVRGDN
jgi:hypothetical protein